MFYFQTSYIQMSAELNCAIVHTSKMATASNVVKHMKFLKKYNVMENDKF